jgi:L-cystine uptake protein TcyP (sodium:dicarboxylate symporter family)
MEKEKKIMENEQAEEKKLTRVVMIFLLLGALIGFILGFLLHDTLVEHNPIDRDIKSWYPR